MIKNKHYDAGESVPQSVVKADDAEGAADGCLSLRHHSWP